MFCFKVCQKNTHLSNNQLQTLNTKCAPERKPVLEYLLKESRAERGNSCVLIKALICVSLKQYFTDMNTNLCRPLKASFSLRAGLDVWVLGFI